MDPKERVAKLLEALANGDSVRLGDFSDQAASATDADMEAAVLRDLADGLREGGLAPA